jgi:hypothetical protein
MLDFMADLRIETVKVDSLKFDPSNARKHYGKNLEAIAGSLQLFGQRKPIIVTPDNIVVAGNGTLEAAKNLGWTEIAISRTPVGWTYDQIKAFALADNRTAELAEWDAEILKEQLLELDSVGWELQQFGFFQLQPPLNPMDEWTGMPDYQSESKVAAFRVSIAFPSEQDANDFFNKIERPKKSSMWWPTDDGHIGSTVKLNYVADE